MSTRIDSDSIVRRSCDLSFSKLDEEMLAIDERAGYYYSMNESAGRVWELIAQPVAVSVVCEQLANEFAVAPDVCLRDVLNLLRALLGAGLVKIEPDS